MSTDAQPRIPAKHGIWWKNAWQAEWDRVKWPSWQSDGRLAQLVAHPLDVREVTSSSLVSSTMRTWTKCSGSLLFFCFSPLLQIFRCHVLAVPLRSSHFRLLSALFALNIFYFFEMFFISSLRFNYTAGVLLPCTLTCTSYFGVQSRISFLAICWLMSHALAICFFIIHFPFLLCLVSRLFTSHLKSERKMKAFPFDGKPYRLYNRQQKENHSS